MLNRINKSDTWIVTQNSYWDYQATKYITGSTSTYSFDRSCEREVKMSYCEHDNVLIYVVH